jgi:hypothetical protein
LVLRWKISIQKDNLKILQIDSGIIARSIGAGSGGFSRSDPEHSSFMMLLMTLATIKRIHALKAVLALTMFVNHHMEILFNCFSITATYLCDRICHLIVLNKLTRTLENYESRQHAVQKLFYSFLPVDTF